MQEIKKSLKDSCFKLTTEVIEERLNLVSLISELEVFVLGRTSISLKERKIESMPNS
jgi:hypothetical protein